MPLPSYPFSAARIFALENKLIGRDRVERMVEAPSAEEVLKILSETEYGAGIAELSHPQEYEKLLAGEIRRLYDLFETISPEPDVTRLFFLKNDFHNLKVLLKSRYLGKEQDEILIAQGGTLPLETLKEAVEDRNYSNLPKFMEEVLVKIDEAMEIKIDPQKMALMLDRAMYSHIFHVCKKSKNSFALEYFTIQAELINIRTFLRVKKIGETFEFLRGLLLAGTPLEEDFFLTALESPIEDFVYKLRNKEYSQAIIKGIDEYKGKGSLSLYERLMDDFLLGFVKARRWNPLGIEPIIGYLLAKENEIRIIRVIMVGKTNDLPAHIIRERLRDVYV